MLLIQTSFCLWQWLAISSGTLHKPQEKARVSELFPEIFAVLRLSCTPTSWNQNGNLKVQERKHAIEKAWSCDAPASLQKGKRQSQGWFQSCKDWIQPVGHKFDTSNEFMVHLRFHVGTSCPMLTPSALTQIKRSSKGGTMSDLCSLYIYQVEMRLGRNMSYDLEIFLLMTDC